MKAKARMKLVVCIWLSPVVRGQAAPAVSLTRDSQRLFPDICAKTAKWFRRY
jgi:hypothetical protein